EDEAAPSEPRSAHRAASLVTIGLLVLVLVALPFAIRSMAATLFGEQQDTLYDLVNGGVAAPVAGAPAGDNQSYVNIAVVNLDPVTGLASLAVSGNRVCPTVCPKVVLTLLALDENAAQRRGLPPSATVTLEPTDTIFSQSVLLPVRGRPNLYPFDAYDLWLGFAVVVSGPDGKPQSLDRALVKEHAVVTLQNQLSQFVMEPPQVIDPARAAAATDPFALPLVESLHFQRPDYLEILAVLLVTLIAVSGSIALMRRAIDDLLLGIGGLILGVWGVRSVLVSQPLPGVSAIDLALSFVILFLLLGLTLRLTRHYHRLSQWPWSARGQR
ncbi:MAG TPA: hypothetical protein VFX03_00535, partial [Thermomicrobiales bacterium]|nr:hypothetical protein [Thermomicrobiales bacterium]